MSSLSPLKFIAAFVVEIGGVGLLVLCLPLLEWPGAKHAAEVNQSASVPTPPQWSSYYRAPPSTNLLAGEPRAVLGRPRILASGLRETTASLPSGIPQLAREFPAASSDMQPLADIYESDSPARRQYVARTLDAASDKLVGAVGQYLHTAVDEALAPPRVITAQPRRMW